MPNPFNQGDYEDERDERVAATRKPTISEACDIADERQKKAMAAVFVEALLQCCTNPDCPKYRKP